jgi:Cu(I)/Ag(I) efflux system membrane fusion protein
MPLDSALSYLTEPVTQTVVGSFKVIEPVTSDPGDTITADGYIGFDQRDINTVSTRVTGRIEKLYVKYTNQQIQKGQPLMEIYSPELLSAQRNLLQVMQDKDQTLISSLKAQLINLGMRIPEIQKVLQNKQPLTNIIIYSPYSGISQQTFNEGMASMNTVSYTSPENGSELLNIREGMYVNMGQTVFSIQNIHRVWAILNVFTNDVWDIRRSDAVNLYIDADKTGKVKGRVDFIPPYRSQNEKTTRVRIYLETLPANWKIGTLIHGQIAISGQSRGVYVPLSAVNRLGMRSVVWVQDKQHDDVFHAAQVRTGLQTEDSLQIISGIKLGDKIVENAAYMVDSDSFIQ